MEERGGEGRREGERKGGEREEVEDDEVLEGSKRDCGRRWGRDGGREERERGS